VSYFEGVHTQSHDKEKSTLMTKEKLQRAGWISITNALFTVPAVAMSFYLESMEGAEARFAQAVLIVASLGLFVYILSSFRQLLNLRFRFHDVDIYISYLLWGNLSLSLFLFLALANKEFESTVSILSILAYIFFGILSVLFGKRLLRLPYRLYGLLKPFSYVTVLSGVCFITVLFIHLGILTGAIADFLLGLIFFRAAEQPPSSFETPHAPIE
jgi:hypothetical protein